MKIADDHNSQQSEQRGLERTILDVVTLTMSAIIGSEADKDRRSKNKHEVNTSLLHILQSQISGHVGAKVVGAAGMNQRSQAANMLTKVHLSKQD
jgi:hypothetical protein